MDDDRFQIRWEWEAGQSVRAPEHLATWARINIFVDSDCVTLVEDRTSGSSRRSIYAPLYPLAEWIVYNWWFLSAHSRPVLTGYEQTARHSLRGVGDGFVWPNLEIIPGGRFTTLSWRRDAAFESSAPIRYLASGDAAISSDTVQKKLTLVVHSVLERLRDQGVPETPLEKEWAALNALDDEEQDFCIAAAQLGLDPLSEADEYEDAIVHAAERLPRTVQADFFGAVHRERIRPAVEWVVAAADQADSVAGPEIATIRYLRDALRAANVSAAVPFRQGWMQAGIIRDALRLDPESRFDVADYATELYRSGVDSGLQALGAAPGDTKPAVVLGRDLGSNAVRFTLGRALWNCFANHHRSSFLITAARTDRQRKERAFAAELLAPAIGIRSLLDVAPEEAVHEDLEIVAGHFGVSTILIEHQINNQILEIRLS